MKFSYIISFKNSNKDREKNLLYILDNLKKIKQEIDFEIIIVEQDEISKINFEDDIRHLFIYNKKLFNKSWGFNCGAKIAQTDLFIFADSDIIIEKNDLFKCLEEIKNFDSIDPKGNVFDLDANGNKVAVRKGVVFGGGIVLIKKEAFLKINGWNEDFEGWGCEDNAMTVKMHRFLKCKKMNFDILHLFHNDRVLVPPRNEMFYKLNEARWKNLEKMSNEQIDKKYFKINIGNILKYS